MNVDIEPLVSAEGVTFTPWTDGMAVGFRVTRPQDDRVEYVILNPSTDHDGVDWQGRGDVFLYHSIATTPSGTDDMDDDPLCFGQTVCFINVFDPADPV